MIKQKKESALENARLHYQSLIKVIDDMLSGESEVSACEKNGVSLACFRKYVQAKPFTNGISSKRLTEVWMEPHQRVYFDVLGIQPTNQRLLHDVPVDLKITVRRVIKELVKYGSQMKEIVYMYYIEEMTLDEIASHFSLSRTTVQQKINEALEIMRRPNIKKRIVRGDKYFKEQRKRRQSNYESLLKKLEPECEEKEREAKERIKAEEEEKKESIAKYEEMSWYELVELMNLSVRATNCIIRSRSYDDDTNPYHYLVSLTLNKVMRTRGVGKKTAAEITNAIKETFGVEIKEDDDLFDDYRELEEENNFDIFDFSDNHDEDNDEFSDLSNDRDEDKDESFDLFDDWDEDEDESFDLFGDWDEDK